MTRQHRVYILEIIHETGVKTQYVNKSSFVLGRGSTSALKIDDQNISREHVKIDFEGTVKILDLNSSNGTYINDTRLKPMQWFPLNENDVIVLGKSAFTFKISTFTPHDAIKGADAEDFQSPVHVIPVSAKNPVNPPEIELPQINPAMKSRSFPTEEENITEEFYQDYRKRIEVLITETKDQMKQLKAETEAYLEKKKANTVKEIEILWQKHHEQTEIEKKNALENLKAQNEVELNLEKERLNSEMFIERNKLLAEAESAIQENTTNYRVQFETEKNEHINQIVNYKNQIEQMKSEYESMAEKAETLKTTNEKISIVQKTLADLEKEQSKAQDSLKALQKSYESTQKSEKNAQKLVADLNSKINSLSQRKETLTTQLTELEKNLAESKLKIKSEVEAEYKALREAESKKFEEFKVIELKELQKIRQAHVHSFKKFSVDLSHEIATKLELAYKVSPEFNFEKHLDIISSVINIKDTTEISTETDQQGQQIETWKSRQKSARSGAFFTGAFTVVLLYFGGTFLYSTFSADSLKQELMKAAELRQKNEIENRFVPEKTDKFFDNYVESTIYTEGFPEVYLDASLQSEWIKKATFYFLHSWKVDEQKTIQVLANSKSLVQNIQEASKKLTKSNLKSELEKLNELEKKNVKQQVEILGTHVKYEAFKKFEKKFFSEKIQKRSMASQPKN